MCSIFLDHLSVLYEICHVQDLYCFSVEYNPTESICEFNDTYIYVATINIYTLTDI